MINIEIKYNNDNYYILEGNYKTFKGNFNGKLPNYFSCNSIEVMDKNIVIKGFDCNDYHLAKLWRLNDLNGFKSVQQFWSLYMSKSNWRNVDLQEMINISKRIKDIKVDLKKNFFILQKDMFSSIKKPFLILPSSFDGGTAFNNKIKAFNIIAKKMENEIEWENRNFMNKKDFYLHIVSKNVNKTDLDNTLVQMMDGGAFSIKGDDIIFYNYEEIENDIYQFIKRAKNFPIKEVKGLKSKFPLTKGQIEAVNAISSTELGDMVVINGFAGTGKTSCLSVLAENEIINNAKILAIAPTSAATDVIKEKTIFDAVTIQKLIFEIENGGELAAHFISQIETILIDEISMIDIGLMHGLISHFERVSKMRNKDFRIIMIGDLNQLTPVDFGSFMKDILLIESNVKVINLTEVVRQQSDSNILKTSINFKNQEKIDYKMQQADCIIDFKLLSDSEIFKKAKKLYVENNLFDNQIMSPVNKINHKINKQVQEILHSNKPCYEIGFNKFCEGDKIIVTKNTVDNLSNGTQAIVSSVHNDKIICHTKGGERFVASNVCSCFSENCKFEETGYCQNTTTINIKYVILGYSITVHKSQGCTFKNALFIGTRDGEVMYKNELIYTAITRASDKFEGYFDERLFLKALNNKEIHRIQNINEKNYIKKTI